MTHPIPVSTFRDPLTLQDLRYERGLTQEAVAAEMGVYQTTVLKLERRADLRLSTLARFIHAMGGRLVVLAQFPDPDGFVAQIALPDPWDTETRESTTALPRSTMPQ